MARWKWALLIFELVLFAMILVLPQVDLPDFAFHGGTAPIAAKARIASISASAQSIAVKNVVALFFAAITEKPTDAIAEATPSHSPGYLSLICTLLC